MESAGVSNIKRLDNLFLHWPSLIVSGLEERRVRQGNPIPAVETDVDLRASSTNKASFWRSLR